MILNPVNRQPSLRWVHKEPEPEPEVDTSLSDEAKEEIKGGAHPMRIRGG